MPVTFPGLPLSNETLFEARRIGEEFEEQIAWFCLVKDGKKSKRKKSKRYPCVFFGDWCVVCATQWAWIHYLCVSSFQSARAITKLKLKGCLQTTCSNFRKFTTSESHSRCEGSMVKLCNKQKNVPLSLLAKSIWLHTQLLSKLFTRSSCVGCRFSFVAPFKGPPWNHVLVNTPPTYSVLVQYPQGHLSHSFLLVAFVLHIKTSKTSRAPSVSRQPKHCSNKLHVIYMQRHTREIVTSIQNHYSRPIQWYCSVGHIFRKL